MTVSKKRPLEDLVNLAASFVTLQESVNSNTAFVVDTQHQGNPAIQLLDARAAQARRSAAATTIFLWLYRHRLQICLARTTAQRQQHEAALAHLRYEQECCARTAMAGEQ